MTRTSRVPPAASSSVELTLDDEDVVVLADAAEQAPEELATTVPRAPNLDDPLPSPTPPLASGRTEPGPVLVAPDLAIEDAVAEELRAAFARASGAPAVPRAPVGALPPPRAPEPRRSASPAPGSPFARAVSGAAASDEAPKVDSVAPMASAPPSPAARRPWGRAAGITFGLVVLGVAAAAVVRYVPLPSRADAAATLREGPPAQELVEPAPPPAPEISAGAAPAVVTFDEPVAITVPPVTPVVTKREPAAKPELTPAPAIADAQLKAAFR